MFALSSDTRGVCWYIIQSPNLENFGFSVGFLWYSPSSAFFGFLWNLKHLLSSEFVRFFFYPPILTDYYHIWYDWLLRNSLDSLLGNTNCSPPTRPLFSKSSRLGHCELQIFQVSIHHFCFILFSDTCVLFLYGMMDISEILRILYWLYE